MCDVRVSKNQTAYPQIKQAALLREDNDGNSNKNSKYSDGIVIRR